MDIKKIGIIGVGNMGGAIAEGLIKSGFADASGIIVSDYNEAVLNGLKQKGMQVAEGNIAAARAADVIILSVKPHHAKNVLQEIKQVVNAGKILISIVAGLSIDEIGNISGADVPVFRVMPNTAIAIQESLTCISYGENSSIHKDYVVEMFDKMGKSVVIPEEMMAAATVLSSCGIAYALRYIRAAMQGGVEIGFSAEMAQSITAQTVKGAAELIFQGGNHPEIEIDRVTTPGGITIAGINEMEHKGFSSSLIHGIKASYNEIDKNK